jgi:RNA polymerase sigma-70 factor (ECF subfamily)
VDVPGPQGHLSDVVSDRGAELLAGYDRALPQVYGYLLQRCGGTALAEDLTGETFLAAVDAVRRDDCPSPTTGWLIGIARHKLVDHWRRRERELRSLRTIAGDPSVTEPADADPWEATLDSLRAQATLETLASQHRIALVLRYVDDLPVRQVADLLGRTEHATETLLVRARRAFRRAYGDPGDDSQTGSAPGSDSDLGSGSGSGSGEAS